MNTKPTTEVLLYAAVYLEESAKELRRYAEDIDKDGSFERVGGALNFLMNIFLNIRVDLLATRPIREMEMEVHRLQQGQKQ